MPGAWELVEVGGMAYADDDFEGARRAWEDAHRALRAAGDKRGAARVAALLVGLHTDIGNAAASRGWLAKAHRLLEGEDPCVERGYVNLPFAACEHPDLDELTRLADEALALATEFDDPALEARALADGGYARVAQGRTAEGFAHIDEALAMITGGQIHDVGMVGLAFCAMLSACDQAGDLRRAEEWTRLAQQQLLDPLGGRPRILHTHCRLAYGSVLCSIGRWTDGEAALREAAECAAGRGHMADAATRLAMLRVLQGRVDEAVELLRPHEDRGSACLPLALAHRADGNLDLAAATIHRGIDRVVADRFREVALLAALVEIELDRDVDRAEAAASRLAEIAVSCDAPLLRAEARLANGRIDAARSDADAAAAGFARALQELGEDERPHLAGTIRFERARALAALGETAAAVDEARAAAATFERLGARPAADRAGALLRSLGAPGSRPRVSVDELTARERDVLDLVRQGMTNAEIGARLYISAKTVEHHVGRVLAKLGVRSRAEAAAVAVTFGGRD